MRRFIVFLILFAMLFSPKATAALGNQGLIINDGIKEIRITVGEKKQIWVRDGLTGLPPLSEVTFYSNNDFFATIGEDSGILQGIHAGTAQITIMSGSGRSARIRVIVERGNKASPLLLLLPIIAICASFLLYRKWHHN